MYTLCDFKDILNTFRIKSLLNVQNIVNIYYGIILSINSYVIFFNKCISIFEILLRLQTYHKMCKSYEGQVCKHISDQCFGTWLNTSATNNLHPMLDGLYGHIASSNTFFLVSDFTQIAYHANSYQLFFCRRFAQTEIRA